MSIRIRLDDVEEEQREEDTEEQESRVHLHLCIDQFGFDDSKRAGFKFQKCGGGRRVIHKVIGSK